MKTITLTSQKVTDGMLLIILGASLFFLMSCQKEDLATNATTFRSEMNSEAVTLLDNTKYPSQLADLRNTAERIFQVTQLIYKERNIESAPEKMNQEHN